MTSLDRQRYGRASEWQANMFFCTVTGVAVQSCKPITMEKSCRATVAVVAVQHAELRLSEFQLDSDHPAPLIRIISIVD